MQLILLLSTFTSIITAQAAPAILAEPTVRVLNMTDFGAKADTGADAGPAVRAALKAVAELNNNKDTREAVETDRCRKVSMSRHGS